MLVAILIIGLIVGYLWAYWVCSKFGRVARFEDALKEIANWENYNLGGDVKSGCQHPAKLAEVALENQ